MWHESLQGQLSHSNMLQSFMSVVI